jgi:predicted AAA+ superfamily ATPase
MIKRSLYNTCFADVFGRQMRFIAGPRQVGKTTLAKERLSEKGCEGLYYNWDKRQVKDRFKTDPYFYNADALNMAGTSKKWICFDEIHKYPKWKNILKDAFDSFEEKYQFIVTGSARLDLFRKSGDSLSGRYFMFRLLPVSLAEMTGQEKALPAKGAKEFIEQNIGQISHQKDLEHMLTFSGFPEPLVNGNEVFSSHWHDEYIDTLVKEDLRDLTKIHGLENVVTLMKLLPGRVGAPLSINSLTEDIGVSYNAVRSYVNSLILTYVIFRVHPYSKKINRALKKESKVYFYDWTLINEPAKRFENYVACELKNRVGLWNGATKYKFELFFVRERNQKETDFLVTRDGEPYFLVEVKLSDENIESHNRLHAEKLGNIPLIQIIKKGNIIKANKDDIYIISAERFF